MKNEILDCLQRFELTLIGDNFEKTALGKFFNTEKIKNERSLALSKKNPIEIKAGLENFPYLKYVDYELIYTKENVTARLPIEQLPYLKEPKKPKYKEWSEKYLDFLIGNKKTSPETDKDYTFNIAETYAYQATFFILRQTEKSEVIHTLLKVDKSGVVNLTEKQLKLLEIIEPIIHDCIFNGSPNGFVESIDYQNSGVYLPKNKAAWGYREHNTAKFIQILNIV